ncbi:SDR family NAD(P)-dependent oxidoreductase [Mesohalobacter halotolerans]|uniref:SDR family oxidoreductase n=1 Tax=Mesohalobacter halotolerans TaxID=1883405 RepID=A0A4U5TNE1_9FLAO|nr:SDR family oxidoreductase [Mesohalobacter halotolerans]MBS3737610.1 SDR family oxidoreductase [Psychroflexus sp.]TKS55440.1 SDR family oxidoreductase [Mesohalobacter halotolerans]
MRKTALITGASSGIGKEFTKQLAHQDYNMVIVARRENLLKALAREITEVKVNIFAIDLTTDNAIEDLLKYLSEEQIQIDVLINNAGFGDYKRFDQADIGKLQNMIDLNIKALTDLTYYIGRQMLRRQTGYILNVASTAAFQPGPMMSVYFATKHYVLAFSEAIAHEWKNEGVIVTALCPGATQSEFFDHADMKDSNLVKQIKLPSSAAVARFGLKQLFKGKTVAIHGFLNKFLVFIGRFTPRNILTKITAKALEK